MKLTKEEKKICKEYSARDEAGYVHCSECPLRIPEEYILCKSNATAEEWREHLEWGEEH